MSEQDILAAVAYRDCLLWAVTQDDITAHFTLDTGMALPIQARTPLDMLIDQATGYDAGFARAFVAWFNTHVWGEDDVPEGVTR